ncbi:hypothetical protein HNR25_003804 [Streptomonospora salina]|uniref:Uncharacterized protein n=1 Tax=Streptomonospora salina TaxID=104205 RepID=A0A841EG91_9ACTN|nr:hypothetical protein [Streptomonospora salina]
MKVGFDLSDIVQPGPVGHDSPRGVRIDAKAARQMLPEPGCYVVFPQCEADSRSIETMTDRRVHGPAEATFLCPDAEIGMLVITHHGLPYRQPEHSHYSGNVNDDQRQKSEPPKTEIQTVAHQER